MCVLGQHEPRTLFMRVINGGERSVEVDSKQSIVEPAVCVSVPTSTSFNLVLSKALIKSLASGFQL